MRELSILDLQEEENKIVRKPVLLKVLCILTWIGSGVQLLIAVSYFASTPEVFLQHADLFVNNIMAQVGNALTAIGALMMWKLNRKGFWLYAVAEIAPLVLSVIVMLQWGDFSDQLQAGFFWGTLVVRIAFVAMYARYYRLFR